METYWLVGKTVWSRTRGKRHCHSLCRWRASAVSSEHFSRTVLFGIMVFPITTNYKTKSNFTDNPGQKKHYAMPNCLIDPKKVSSVHSHACLVWLTSSASILLNKIDTNERPWVETGAFSWRARGCKVANFFLAVRRQRPNSDRALKIDQVNCQCLKWDVPASDSPSWHFFLFFPLLFLTFCKGRSTGNIFSWFFVQ